jgi:hypothetical protein
MKRLATSAAAFLRTTHRRSPPVFGEQRIPVEWCTTYHSRQTRSSAKVFADLIDKILFRAAVVFFGMGETGSRSVVSDCRSGLAQPRLRR